MLKSLSIFVKKEIKDLMRDPKILFSVILLPALIYIILGQTVSFAITKVAEESVDISIIVIDNDTGEWSKHFLNYIKAIGLPRLEVYTNVEPDLFINKSYSEKFDCLIVIPDDFSYNINHGIQARVEIFTFVNTLGLTSLTKLEIASKIIEDFSKTILTSYLKEAYPDKDIASLLMPIIQYREVVIKNERYPESVGYNLSNQGFLLVLGPILVLSIVTSIAATSMGVEKEEKTLEVLLSLPLKRSEVIIAKATATAIISILGAISLSLGLFSYIGSIFSATGTNEELTNSLNIMANVLGIINLIKLGLGLVLCLLLGSILGLIVASFASNVREAQALANSVWMPVLIIFMLLSFVDLDVFSKTTQVALSILPFSAPVIVLKTALSTNTYLSNISIMTNLIYLLLTLWLSIKWFDSERILTSKPSFKFYKKRK